MVQWVVPAKYIDILGPAVARMTSLTITVLSIVLSMSNSFVNV